MNFFQPQSCSFLQKRCRVSEYLLFLGSLHVPARSGGSAGAEGQGAAGRRAGAGQEDAPVDHGYRELRKVAPTRQQLVIVRDAEEQGEVVGDVAPLGVKQDVPARRGISHVRGIFRRAGVSKPPRFHPAVGG